MYLSNSGTYMELRTTSFIESTSCGVGCSDSVCHNRVQVLNIFILLLPCTQDWAYNLQMIVSLEGDPHGLNKRRTSKFRVGSRVRQTPKEGRGTYRPKRCGNNNKDEDNRLKTFIDKNHQASSQKFRQLTAKRYSN